MSYHELSIAVVRQACRNAIESLERWLRRLVRETFTQRYGPEFLHATTEHGQQVIPKRVRDEIVKRATQHPGRYPHPIDATHLDDIIDIICREDHYNRDFKPALAGAFPQGREVARFFLGRIIPPRNNLSHDNPISVRQAEQVICYCNDVIDSLKEHARVTGQERLFNVPSFVSFEDSLGNRPILPEPFGGIRLLRFTHDERCHLRPGEKLRMSIEVDASFSEDQYRVEWSYLHLAGIWGIGKEVVLELTESDVRQDLIVVCRIISTKSWHRFGDCDDQIFAYYLVRSP